MFILLILVSFVGLVLTPISIYTWLCTGMTTCRYEFVIFYARLQGDLAAAAAFCTSKKALPPAIQFTVFHKSLAAVAFFEMSSCRQRCNGGQPQRRKSV